MHQSEGLYRVIGLYSCRLDAWLVRADVPRERAGTRRRGECRHVARADVTADTESTTDSMTLSILYHFEIAKINTC